MLFHLPSSRTGSVDLVIAEKYSIAGAGVFIFLLITFLCSCRTGLRCSAIVLMV